MITCEDNIYKSTEGELFTPGTSMLAYCENCQVAWNFFDDERCFNCKSMPWKFDPRDGSIEEVGIFISVERAMGTIDDLALMLLTYWTEVSVNGFDNDAGVPRWAVEKDLWHWEFEYCLAIGAQVDGPNIQRQREWSDHRSALIRHLQDEADMGGNTLGVSGPRESDSFDV